MSLAPDGLAGLAAGGKRALARALAAIETEAGDPALADLLDDAHRAPRGHVLGLTGPPGVGKSSLVHALIGDARRNGETVAAIAVDPSSTRSGGALLGDRARISPDPEDRGIFVRSMAARDRLGGLSDVTIAAVALMRHLFDLVIVETVGVGQSETDVALVADTVLLCVQPGAGDSLQFMKAGVMETPDVIAITKADTGAPAARAKSEVLGALTLNAPDEDGWRAPVALVSTQGDPGLGPLREALGAHRAFLAADGRGEARRADQAVRWVEAGLRARFGSLGLAAARREKDFHRAGEGPFARERRLGARLAERLG